MNIKLNETKLDPQKIQSNLFSYIAFIAIGAVLTGLWINGIKSSYILCSADCGETFDALQYVSNYNLYGFKYRLVQDLATSPKLDAHPYFYTHNANLAGYFFTILEAIGVEPLWAKQFLTLIIFGLGLFYIYQTVSFYTSSRLVGLITLLLFCSDYEHILVFGLNSLRAWHWLALFGLMFHVKRIRISSEENTVPPIIDYLLFTGFAIISFCLGYDFWVICVFIIFWLLFFFLKRPLLSKANLSIVLVVGLIFLIPFILRQLQIMSGLGLYFWAKDLYYSAAIKVPFLSRLFLIPSIEQIDQFYKSYNVLRPPAFQSPSLSQNLVTLRDMLINITIPTYGTISAILGVILCLSSIIIGVVGVFSANKKYDWGKSLIQLEPAKFDLINTGKFLAALSLGIIFGLGFFAPLSFHIYLKHQFPLIAVLFILPKAFLIAIGLQFLYLWCRNRPQKTVKTIIVIGIVLVLIGDHILVQYDNYLAKKPIDVTWIDTVENMPGQTFAVSWIPSSVSIFTHNWVVGISRGRELDVFKRLNTGLPPFQIGDYLLFGERDAATNLTKYLHPSFLLYFPTEQLSYFDSPVPVCRQDYLVEFFQRIFPRSDPQPTPPYGVMPQSVLPGGEVFLAGKIVGRNKGVEHIYALGNNEVLGELQYNCIYNQYVGIIQIPQNANDGKYDITIRADYVNGKQFVISETNIDVSKTASSNYTLPNVNVPQKSVEQVVSEYPNLKVYKKGTGFVIFDLRN